MTMICRELLNNLIGHFGELLFHLVKKLHDADVGARAFVAAACVVVLIDAARCRRRMIIC